MGALQSNSKKSMQGVSNSYKNVINHSGSFFAVSLTIKHISLSVTTKSKVVVDIVLRIRRRNKNSLISLLEMKMKNTVLCTHSLMLIRFQHLSFSKMILLLLRSKHLNMILYSNVENCLLEKMSKIIGLVFRFKTSNANTESNKFSYMCLGMFLA